MDESTDVYMRRAIELSVSGLAAPGLKPFGAVVVRDGQIIGEGVNRVEGLFDITAHGEIEAIRDASRRQGSNDLSGCEMYTSCEPCTLCVSAMHLAGISHLYYAASLETAGRAVAGSQPSFTTRFVALREQAGKPTHDRAMPAQQSLEAEAVDVLKRWSNLLQQRKA